MQTYFRLQFYMLNRQLVDFGLVPLLGYVLGTSAFIGLSIFLFNKSSLAVPIYLFMALFYTLPLSDARRNRLLKTCFSVADYRCVRLLENLVVVLPFMLFLLIQMEWLAAGVLFLFGGMGSLLNLHVRNGRSLPTPFNSRPFEFLTGFRRLWWLLLAVYLLAGIALSVGNFNLGIFALFLVFFISCSFYSEPEAGYFVWLHAIKPQAFLHEKCGTAILHSSILSLPVLGALLFFHVESIGIILLVQLLGYAYLLTFVLAKYAAFPQKASIPQAIIIALGIWFPPALLAIVPYFFTQAVRQLNPFLE